MMCWWWGLNYKPKMKRMRCIYHGETRRNTEAAPCLVYLSGYPKQKAIKHPSTNKQSQEKKV